jgi:hypothetical protein
MIFKDSDAFTGIYIPNSSGAIERPGDDFVSFSREV